MVPRFIGELAPFSRRVEAELDGGHQLGRKAGPAEARPYPVEERPLEAILPKTAQTFIQMLVYPANFLRREVPVEIVVQSAQNLLTRHVAPPFT